MKGYIKWAAALLAAVLILAVWQDRTRGVYKLQGVSEAIEQNSSLYLMDNNGDTYNLFWTDRLGRILGRIDRNKLVGDWWHTYSSFTLGTDGQVYIYCHAKSMVDDETKSTVYRCDFGNGTLEPVWDLPLVSIFKIQVIDGSVYYVAPASGESCAVYRMALGGAVDMVCEINTPFSSIKDAIWDPVRGVMWADWGGRFYRNGQEVNQGDGYRDYANIHVNPTGIYYTDLTDNCLKTIGWDANQASTLYPTAQVELTDPAVEYMDVLPFHYMEDKSWIGGVDISPTRRILGIFDSGGRQTGQLEQVALPGPQRLRMAALTVCLGLAAGAALYVLGKLALGRTGGMVPITVRLLGILIPVIAGACLVLNNQLKRSLEKRLLQMNYDLLYVIADQKLSAINPRDLEAVDLQNIPGDPVYSRLFETTDYSALAREIYDVDSLKRQPVIASVYQWIFLEKDGALRYLLASGRHFYGARVSYDRNRQEIRKMEEAMKRRQIVKTEYNDFTGDFVALYVPVVDREGRSVGVLESGFNRRILIYEIQQQMQQIYWLLGGLLGLLAGVLALVLGFSLHPLSRVTEAVEEVGRGSLGRMVRVCGRDEVAAIGRAFNHMSARLKEQVDYIQACSDGYASFVPRKVMEILDREDITRIRLGDQKEMEAAVLDVYSLSFLEMSRSMTGEDLYGMMNQMLSRMIPIVSVDQGVVDHMKEDGLTAYYPGGGEGALRSAVSICEQVNSLRDAGENIPVYRAAVNYGRVRLGIVGGEGRMEASTISELMAMSGFLKELGERCGARILMMEAAAARIDGFDDRYHARMIGYIHRKISGRREKVYDVYDGDRQQERMAKEETAGIFAQAMAAYEARDFYRARGLFARILRRNGGDLAARIYVYRCDQYCQSGDEKTVPPYLEEY